METTWQLMRRCMPTRQEKHRVGRALGIRSQSHAYAICEDPEGSGRPNPLDKLETVLDHAMIHHPDAALAVVQRLEAKVARSLSARAAALPLADLLVVLQPGAESEALDVVRALSAALRQVLLGGDCDVQALLTEVEQLEREARKVGVMLRAAHDAQKSVRTPEARA